MAFASSKSNFTALENLGLNDTLGIQFSGRTSNPADADLAAGRLYYDSSASALKIYNGSSWTTLGGGGGGGTPSWETIYQNDNTFAITAGTWTITQSAAAAILTLNKTNVSTGAVIAITNSGTGADISNGTAWTIFGTGGVGVVELSSTGSINTVSGALTIGKTSTATTFLGTITVAEAATFTSGGVTVTSGALTVSSGALLVSSGVSTMISASNTAPTLLMTNNTVSTYGVGGASTGMALIRSTSLTTGVLLRLQTTEATLTSGKYIDCFDVTANGSVFSISKTGVTVIAGTAGSASLTLTTGNILVSAGSVTSALASDAVILSMTNNTATTASAFVFSATGAHTGTTTTSAMTITLGSTIGTGMYIPTAALTTGKVIQLIAGAATDAILIDVLGGGVNMTSTGRLLKLSMGAATDGRAIEITSSTGAYAGAGLITVTSNSMAAGGVGVLISSTSVSPTTGSLLRVSSGTTGTVATNGLVSFVATAAFGSTSNVGLVNCSAVLTTTGTILNVLGGALVSGVAVNIADSGTGITTGSLIKATTGTTGAVATNGVFSFVGTGNFTVGSALLGLFNVTAASTAAGTIMNISGGALTTGVALSINDAGTGMTSGSLLRVASASTGAVSGSGVVSFIGTGAHTGTTVGFVHISSATAAGYAMTIAAASLTSGSALVINDGAGTGLAAGSLLKIATASTSAISGGVVAISASGAYTSTAGLLNVTATASTAGGLVVFTNNALLTGALLSMSATGTYTGTGIVNLQATGATTGTVMLIAATLVSTGTVIDISGNTGLTTGKLVNLVSNSADTSARKLLYVENTNSAATGCVPISSKQGAATSTNYYKLSTYVTASGTVTLWMGNGTDPNGVLSATAGDILFNGASNKPAYCTGTTVWVNLV